MTKALENSYAYKVRDHIWMEPQAPRKAPTPVPTPQHGYALSTYVKLDLYLLEVARHALQAPVRGGLCRRAIDWPLSSAQDSCGLRSPPAWLDPTPLHDLLGQRDERGHERFRRFIGCC